MNLRMRKCCTDDRTIAFISAFHSKNHNETASLQIITNDAAFNISFDYLKYQENQVAQEKCTAALRTK